MTAELDDPVVLELDCKNARDAYVPSGQAFLFSGLLHELGDLPDIAAEVWLEIRSADGSTVALPQGAHARVARIKWGTKRSLELARQLDEEYVAHAIVYSKSMDKDAAQKASESDTMSAVRRVMRSSVGVIDSCTVWHASGGSLGMSFHLLDSHVFQWPARLPRVHEFFNRRSLFTATLKLSGRAQTISPEIVKFVAGVLGALGTPMHTLPRTQPEGWIVLSLFRCECWVFPSAGGGALSILFQQTASPALAAALDAEIPRRGCGPSDIADGKIGSKVNLVTALSDQLAWYMRLLAEKVFAANMGLLDYSNSKRPRVTSQTSCTTPVVIAYDDPRRPSSVHCNCVPAAQEMLVVCPASRSVYEAKALPPPSVCLPYDIEPRDVPLYYAAYRTAPVADAVHATIHDWHRDASNTQP
jgi:hypothetical protein